MKKKILSLILALLMTASAASTVLADEAIADVEETAAVEEVVEAGQYDKAIEFLNNYGIFKGKSADDLGAEDMLERYQMALFVSRISTGWVDDDKWEDGPEDWSEFTDISEGPVANYWGAISYANQKGIIEGYGNGKFGPTDGIKYEDALTMVVRTLGYQGLEWPWGYIEKAVELGLTDGITGVAYKDQLNRGEVAQILYNALFATTKNGTTLGMSSFGIEFGWEKVVITASDLNIFTQDSDKATKKLESDNAHNYFKDSYKTEEGYVSFKILNDDGSLGDDTYYVPATEFGLSGGEEAHDDEAVVGDAYYVLFEKDEDSDLAKVVAYESLLVDTLVNEGKTDDKGKAQEYPIETFKDEYALVSKYSDKTFVNTTKSGKPEVLVYVANGQISEEYVAGNYIAIDWETGDILEPTKDDDGDFIVDEDGNYEYKVAWYYNELLGKYYQYVYDVEDEDGIYSGKNGNKTGSYDDVFAINYMTDKEFEKYYESLNWKATRYHRGFAQPVEKLVKSAYASLKLFDTNLDGTADRGTYESYRLGYFTEDVIWCGSCGKNIASYKIDDVSTLAKAYESADMYNDKTDDDDGDVIKVNMESIMEGVACSHITDRAWFVEGYEPMTAYDEDGEEDGYAAGYVIYNYDAETGAIKVVKNIADGSDEDTYVATGVVRAYNVKNGTVTIGDTQFSIKDYDELEGNGFKYVTENWKTRAQYTGMLRSLFNQFVNYVVVDGELVHIEAANATTKAVIVVDSYAGLSSDGYIVVNGYHTDTLEYDQFRIGSYNGWMQGDYYYYLIEAKAEASFTKGAIYAITSYDKENDAYYVNLAGEFEGLKNGKITANTKYVIDTDYVSTTSVKIENGNDGYMVYTDKDDKTRSGSVKMKDTDKYVIIPEAVEGRPYATIKVYEGKLGTDWEVEGDRINSTDKNNRTYVIVNAKITKGFDDTYKSGLVLLLSDKYISLNYNGADSDSWYLLGASAAEVEVFNLYTGKEENVILPGTNIDLDVGHVYYTQDDVIVEDLGALSMNDIVIGALHGYEDRDADTAEYVFGSFQIDETKAKGENYYANLFGEVKYDGTKVSQKEFIANVKNTDTLYTGADQLFEKLGQRAYRGNIDSVKVFGVEYSKTTQEISKVYELSLSKFEKIVEDLDSFIFNVYYVYDIDGDDVVLYVDLVEAEKVATGDAKESDAFLVKDFNNGEAKIYGKVVYEEETTNGKVSAYNILGVKYYFDGTTESAKGTHINLAKNGYNFGLEGDHWMEDYSVYYTVRDLSTGSTEFDAVEGEKVWASIVDYQYMDGKNDCDDCALVQGIYVEFKEAVTIPVEQVEDGIFLSAFEIDVQIVDNENNSAFFNKVDVAYKVADGKKTGIVFGDKADENASFRNASWTFATATPAVDDIYDALTDILD